MKLCTTISSERGKTIQKTGNEYIRIELLVGSTKESELFCELNLKETDDKGYVLYLTDRVGETKQIYTMRVKPKIKPIAIDIPQYKKLRNIDEGNW